MLGIDAAVVNEQGEEMPPDKGGLFVIKKPWPGMLRGIHGDRNRFISNYWSRVKDPATGQSWYFSADGARRDKDGYFWIMGRIDDVLNVAGHRLGTMEIESALVAHSKVAEAAVVGKPHDIKGESVFAYVVLRGDRPTGAKIETFTKELRDWVTEQLGAIARPDDIRFADNLPKTRSGKIMRRLLRAIARNEDITQDLSTLENPAIVEQLRGNERAKPARVAHKTRAKATAAAKNKPAVKQKAVVKKKAQPAKKSVKAAARTAAPKKSAPRNKPVLRKKKPPRKKPAPRTQKAPRKKPASARRKK
jgi:hypothetical protein